MDLPKRSSDISPFIVMEVLEKAQEMEAQGIDIIHLEVGEPDFEIPESVKIASNVAMRTGYTHYTHSLGDPQLRKVISRQYHNRYGVEVDPDRIVITSGSSPAIHLVLSVIMDYGQEVIIPDPGYACYPNFIKHLGGNQFLYIAVKKVDFNTILASWQFDHKEYCSDFYQFTF
jgi:aspartate/methionine/tyrosine aminotransferase